MRLGKSSPRQENRLELYRNKLERVCRTGVFRSAKSDPTNMSLENAIAVCAQVVGQSIFLTRHPDLLL